MATMTAVARERTSSAACCDPSTCGRRGRPRAPALSTHDELRAAEDRAVLEAIALQEGAGIEAITDGEYRRTGVDRLHPDGRRPALHRAGERLRVPRRRLRLARPLEDGRRASPPTPRRCRPRSRSSPGGSEVERDIVGDEYAFLKANAHARAKYTIPAPSWHRIFWHPEYSSDAYPTSDDFIEDVARLTREHIVDRLVELGCDYIQIDAPNYAQWHIDPGNRAAFEEHGHDMAHELVADAEFDNMVFEGLTGVTRAMHMCRGNAPGGMWAATGGYEAISKRGLPAPDEPRPAAARVRHATARAAFAPLADVLPQPPGRARARDDEGRHARGRRRRSSRAIEEATQYVPLERLALSPQCGFASGEIARTMTAGASRRRSCGSSARSPGGSGRSSSA